MERTINDNLRGKIHTEKITNESFDEIIGHSEEKRKYFTIENNDIIYKRLKNEVSIEYLPYLGSSVDFGMGDICIEETKDNFKFYLSNVQIYPAYKGRSEAMQRMIREIRGIIDDTDNEGRQTRENNETDRQDRPARGETGAASSFTAERKPKKSRAKTKDQRRPE